MEKLHYEIEINAPREKVWHTMLDEASYREWTKAFNPTSRYVGEWKEGTKILFVGCDPETGIDSGMVSFIKSVKPFEYVSIEHKGVVTNGVEVTTGPEVEGWAGAHENYEFIDDAGGTKLVVELDIDTKFKDMFDDMWPKALALLKQSAERN